MSANANCDKCSQEFTIEPQEQKIAHELYGEISRRFFSCPRCSTEYDFGYVDARVQALIDENAAMLKKQNKDRNDRKLYDHNMKKIQKLSGRLGQAWEKYHRIAADIG
jgi:hypothetical protein